MRNPDDDFAMVELWRWQYGKLPLFGETRSLDLPAGLRAMARAIRSGCEARDASKMPTPDNVCEVLEFCARQFQQIQDTRAAQVPRNGIRE